jgi:hypothetical protein
VRNIGIKEEDDRFGDGWSAYEEDLGRSRMNVPIHDTFRTLTTAPRAPTVRTSITNKVRDRGNGNGNGGRRTITSGVSKKHHRSRNTIRTSPKKISNINSNNEIGDATFPEMSQASPLSRRKATIFNGMKQEGEDAVDTDAVYETDNNEIINEQVRRDPLYSMPQSDNTYSISFST